MFVRCPIRKVWGCFLGIDRESVGSSHRQECLPAIGAYPIVFFADVRSARDRAEGGPDVTSMEQHRALGPVAGFGREPSS